MSFRDARSSTSVHISSRSCLQLSWCQRKPQKGRGPSSSVTATKPARVSDNTPPKPLSLPLQLNRGKSSPTCPALFLYSHGVPRHGQCAHEPWQLQGGTRSPAELSALLWAPQKGLLVLLRCWENLLNLVGAALEPQWNVQCSPRLGCGFAELLSPREGKINPRNLWGFFKAQKRFGPSCFWWRTALPQHRDLEVMEHI